MVFVLPTSLTSFGVRWKLRVRGFTRGRLYVQTKEWIWKDSLTPPPPSLQCSSEPFNKRFKRLSLPVPRTGKLVPCHCCPPLRTQRLGAATSASVCAVQTPLCPLSAWIIIVPPSLPAPGSHGMGTQRQLQTVAQGLVNVSELWTHHRLHFEPYTARYWRSWRLKVFFQQPVGCLLLF